MFVLFNSEIVKEGKIEISFQNRAFAYGDGLFESIYAKNETIQLLPFHIQRLKRGMTALGMEVPFSLNELKIKEEIFQIISLNELEQERARIKLFVWRKDGGLFTPTNNQINYLISVQKAPVIPHVKNHVEFSSSVKLNFSSISRFKTCNMLPYILASIERQKRNLDDLILTDQRGYISECTSSNIFWKKKGEYFTPSLFTGCIEGVKRRDIIETLNNKNIPVQEVEASIEELLSAEEVFTSNASGIIPIKRIQDSEFLISEFPF